MITSASNKRVKYVRSLHRRKVRHREERFLAEGLRLVSEALDAPKVPTVVFHTPQVAASPEGVRLLDAANSRNVECCPVTDEIMALMADTVTPQGALAVVPFQHLATREHPRLVLVLDRLRDPGNLGTVLRTAAAAGVEQVLTMPGTVDVYAPKVVRAGMGAHFRLPIRACPASDDQPPELAGMQVLLATPSGERVYWEVDWELPTALILGSEAKGAGETTSRWATGYVSIPMSRGVESLNVASAAAILLFEATRQGRVSG